MKLTQRNPKRQVFSSRSKFSIVKATNAAGKKIATLRGYAIVWNQLSDDRGGYKVRLLPGSATFADPCLALHDHDDARVLGNTVNQSLRYTLDAYGALVEIDLPDTTDGRDIEELVENGYVNAMSFGTFDIFDDAEYVVEGGQRILNVKSFTVDEVTVTVRPAFVGTTIQVAEDDVPEDEGEQMSRVIKGETKEIRHARLKLSQYKLSMYVPE